MSAHNLFPPNESSTDDHAQDDDEHCDVNADIDPDDPRWDVFVADEDELDPEPEHSDFWPEY